MVISSKIILATFILSGKKLVTSQSLAGDLSGYTPTASFHSYTASAQQTFIASASTEGPGANAIKSTGMVGNTKNLYLKSFVAGPGVTINVTANEIQFTASSAVESDPIYSLYSSSYVSSSKNTGSGAGFYIPGLQGVRGKELLFKTLVAGPNIYVSESLYEIFISSSATGGGGSTDVSGYLLTASFNSYTSSISSSISALTLVTASYLNTASNIGPGSIIYSGSRQNATGKELVFKTILAGTNVTITETSESIQISSSQATSSWANNALSASYYSQSVNPNQIAFGAGDAKITSSGEFTWNSLREHFLGLNARESASGIFITRDDGVSAGLIFASNSGSVTGSWRWSQFIDNNNNFGFRRYDTASGLLGTVLELIRETGDVRIPILSGTGVRVVLVNATGSLTASNQVPSASYADTALSASYAPGSPAISSSYATTALSASYAAFALSASYAALALSASYSVSSSYTNQALSASYAPINQVFKYTASNSYDSGSFVLYTWDVENNYTDTYLYYVTTASAAGISPKSNPENYQRISPLEAEMQHKAFNKFPIGTVTFPMDIYYHPNRNFLYVCANIISGTGTGQVIVIQPESGSVVATINVSGAAYICPVSHSTMDELWISAYYSAAAPNIASNKITRINCATNTVTASLTITQYTASIANNGNIKKGTYSGSWVVFPSFASQSFIFVDINTFESSSYRVAGSQLPWYAIFNTNTASAHFGKCFTTSNNNSVFRSGYIQLFNVSSSSSIESSVGAATYGWYMFPEYVPKYDMYYIMGTDAGLTSTYPSVMSVWKPSGSAPGQNTAIISGSAKSTPTNTATAFSSYNVGDADGAPFLWIPERNKLLLLGSQFASQMISTTGQSGYYISIFEPKLDKFVGNFFVQHASTYAGTMGQQAVFGTYNSRRNELYVSVAGTRPLVITTYMGIQVIKV